MQGFLDTKPNDGVNFYELFVTLLAYKLLIASTFVLGIFFSINHMQNTEKKYTAEAIFAVSKKNTSGGFSMPGQFASLAALTGINNTKGSLPRDQVAGRIFIKKLDAKLNFQDDTYFNSYNPNLVDPIWKSLIKRAIGWQKSSPNVEEAIWQSITKTYSSNVLLNETEGGSAKIVVTHVDPQRAAKIANVIMDTIISDGIKKHDIENKNQLTYLSNSLAEVLSDLEISQVKLKEFTLGNSALPLEEFAAKSLQLDTLRKNLSRTSKLHDAVSALLVMLQNKTTEQNNYLLLRQQYPIVDQVEFRRVLGQNEIISSWSWPQASSVITVFDTLSERKSRLETQIDALQVDAERLGLAVQTYAKLQREATIAEATYTVLIEQVKAKSMLSGYNVDTAEIYEYASPPIYPSSPNRNIILFMGATLGLLLGVTLSLLLAFSRGVYYSKNALKNGAQARLTVSIRGLLPLRNKSLNDISSNLKKKPRPALRELAVEIHKNAATQVTVTSSRSKMTSNDLARALTCYMQSDKMKIAVIDFSSKSKKLDNDNERPSIGSFVIAESAEHVSVLRPDDDLEPMELLGQKSFWGNIQSLNSTFDLVFLCADNKDAISLLNALEGQKTLHITLARTKRTKSATLSQMRSLFPIQGLLHD